MGAPAVSGGQAANFTSDAGFLSFYEVCDMLRSGATLVWDNEQQVCFIQIKCSCHLSSRFIQKLAAEVSASDALRENSPQVPYAFKDDQWVGFDDQRSLKMKIQWLKENGYSGVMIW